MAISGMSTLPSAVLTTTATLPLRMQCAHGYSGCIGVLSIGCQGTETYYSFGNDRTALCDHGRFASQDSPFPWRDGCGDDTASPIPVGQRKPNPWGIFDMHGNAWEWVEDCSTPPTDPFSRARSCVDARIMRGGSWANNPWELGSAVRRLMGLTFRRSNIGFRVALSLGD